MTTAAALAAVSLRWGGIVVGSAPLAEGPDVNRTDFLLFLGPSSLGLGLFLGINSGSWPFSFFVSFLGFLRQVMWSFMTSDPVAL